MATTQDEAREIQDSMALLSPAERAALADDGDSETEILDQIQEDETSTRPEPKELAEPTEATGKSNDLGDDGTDELSDDEQAALDAQAAQEKADADLAAQQAEEVAAAEAPADPVPDAQPVAEQPAQTQEFSYAAPPVEDFEARQSALQLERSKALADLLAGAISPEDYSAIDTRANAEMNAMNLQQTRHVMAEDMRRQQEAHAWNREINSVKTQAKAEGVDYDANPKYAKAWDGWVKQLASDPENNEKPGDWFLKEAHKNVKLQYNLSKVDTAQVDAAPKPAVAPPKPAVKPRTPDLSNIPPTLGKAPAAATDSEGDTGEFAYIDKLVGIKREMALAKLTPDQESRYMAED